MVAVIAIFGHIFSNLGMVYQRLHIVESQWLIVAYVCARTPRVMDNATCLQGSPYPE